jgi:hypothetical protein
MDNDRTLVDLGELGFATTVVRQNERAARTVSATVGNQNIELPTDDPLRVHRHFLPAFAEFTEVWAREVLLVADAAKDLAASMDASAQALLERDRADGSNAGKLIPK